MQNNKDAQPNISHCHGPVLINDTLHSLEDFYAALASSLWLPHNQERPVPRNLDHMADLLKETRVKKVICSYWRLPDAETARILEVFEDLGIALVRRIFTGIA